MNMLSETVIRRFTSDDVTQMISLWHTVFGDRDDFIRGFYAMLPRLGTAVVAEKGSRIVGIAHILTCMSLERPSQSPVSCGYLYAVAVDPEFRSLGLGAALSCASQKLASENGAEIFCTSPAEPSLYQWYHSILQTEPVLYRVAAQTEAAAASPPVELSAMEYNALREQALSSVPHMALSDSGAVFLRFLCRSYGGGLFRSDSSIAALASDDSGTVLYELLPTGVDFPGGPAMSASQFADSGQVTYYLPSLPDIPGACPFLASSGTAFSANTVWNLVFE